MVSARHPDALVEFEYDAAGSVTAEILNGRRTEYARDPLNGRPLSWQLDTLGMTFAHGPEGKLTRWQVNGHAPLYLTHDAAGRETHRYSPAGFQLGQRHSPTGMLLDQWTGPAEAQDITRHFGYDRAYNVTNLIDNRWERRVIVTTTTPG